jgi:hypothetical protein
MHFRQGMQQTCKEEDYTALELSLLADKGGLTYIVYALSSPKLMASIQRLAPITAVSSFQSHLLKR